MDRPGKTLQECCRLIAGSAKRAAKNSGAQCAAQPVLFSPGTMLRLWIESAFRVPSKQQSFRKPILFIYIFSLFFHLVLACYGFFNRRSVIFVAFSFVFVFVVAAFRFDVGVDFKSYVRIFDALASSSESYGHTEPGFNFLVFFLDYFGFGYQSIFFVFAFFTSYFFYKYIKYFSVNVPFSIFVYVSFPIFYLATFNQIRQFLAVAMFAYSLRFVVENRFLKFFTFIVLAGFFHKSAFVIILVYPFLMLKPSLASYSFVFLIYLFVLGFSEFFLFDVLGFTRRYLEPGSQGNIFLFFAFFFVFFIVCCFVKDKRYNVFVNLVFFAVIIMATPFLSSYPQAEVMRIGSYFTISLIVLVPYIMEIISPSRFKLIYFFLICFFLSFYYIFTLLVNGEAYNLVPYYFYGY